MVRFVSLVYSPWSEKARWALDHHRIEYRPVAYQPMLSELPLRMRMRRFGGTLTVPVMQTDDGWLTDSWDIARWADEHGDGAPLFADGQPGIEHFNELSERALEAARALGLQRFLGHDTRLRSLVPRRLGAMLGPLAPRVAAFGVRRTLRKYSTSSLTEDEHRFALRDALDEVRETLGGSSQGQLVGDALSYADIAMAQVFQFVAPANLGGFRMSEAGRDGYRDPELADAYADLIAWRDWLYTTYRN
jgi:glutathione S-transferase